MQGRHTHAADEVNVIEKNQPLCVSVALSRALWLALLLYYLFICLSNKLINEIATESWPITSETTLWNVLNVSLVLHNRGLKHG